MGGIWRTVDAGVRWTQVLALPPEATDGVGVSHVVMDKDGPAYAIVYGYGIYESTDRENWRLISGSPTRAMRMVVANGNLYVTSEVSTTAPITRGFYKYAGGTWSVGVTPGGGAKDFNAIAVNPTNPNDVLTATWGYAPSKMYRSKDGGDTWSAVDLAYSDAVSWHNATYRGNHIMTFAWGPYGTYVWFSDWYGVWRTTNIDAATVTFKSLPNGHEESGSYALVSPWSTTLPELVNGGGDVGGFRMTT